MPVDYHSGSPGDARVHGVAKNAKKQKRTKDAGITHIGGSPTPGRFDGGVDDFDSGLACFDSTVFARRDWDDGVKWPNRISEHATKPGFPV